MNIPQLDNTYIANTYARFPVTIARGKGSLVWDENGKVYIDMATGIAVNSFGIADPAWIRAVTEQLCTVQHASNLYYTAPDAQLAQLLCEKTGMKKVFFSNSGAEANECAIKAARKYAADHKGPEYSTIITLKNSFHGRTITTLAATGQDVFHHDFLPLTEGFAYAEANNLDDLKAQVAAHKCAAIMMEVVQGEGGVIPLTQEFVKGAARLAAEQDLLLICDEVQIGNGRSGKLYGYMHYGITPDIVSTAKGLGGGLPLGATLLGEKVQDVLTPGSHGSTFGGNPVCCAGALSILHRLDGPLLQSVQEKSDFIVSSLTGAKGVKSVTGLGLMLGVETERPVKDVIADCMERGVLVISAKNKVRLLPALNIPMAQLVALAADEIRTRLRLAEAAAVHQNGASGRAVEPAAVQHGLRLTGTEKVPRAAAPDLDPRMVVVTVRPARHIDLPRRKAAGAQDIHREHGLLAAATEARAEHGQRAARALVRRLIDHMLRAPAVDLQNGGLLRKTAQPLGKRGIEHGAAVAQRLIIDARMQHIGKKQRLRQSARPRNVLPQVSRMRRAGEKHLRRRIEPVAGGACRIAKAGQPRRLVRQGLQ